MATHSKYVYFSGDNFLDLGLDYSQLTLKGQSIQVLGTADIDRVFLRPGTAVDFVQSGGGSDKLYLEGRASDYTFSVTGTILNVSRGTGATAESAQLSANAVSTDVLVFADGTLAATTLRNYVQSPGAGAPSAPLPVPTGETSGAPVLPASYAGSARFVASSATTFAPVEPGISVELWGSVEVDTVYVNPGSTVLATRLGGGQDLVYFTGTFADYTKSVLGTYIVFERDINGAHEQVTVARGTSLAHDLWIFADGAAGSYNIYQAVSQATAAGASVPPLSTMADYDATLVTPGAVPHTPVIAVAGGGANVVNAAATGLQLDVSYDNIRPGDVLRVELAGAAIGLAHTVSQSEAAAGHATITVAKVDLGAMDGVKHLTVTASNRSGSASSGELLVTLDTAAPAAPQLVAAHAYAGADAATASSGAVSFSAETGSLVKVIFAVGPHQVEKQLVATGGSQAVVLTAADLLVLGDGPVAVTAQAVDAAANPSSVSSTSFVLDTTAPIAPTVTVASPFLDRIGAINGPLTISAEADARVTVRFTNGVHMLEKGLLGTGQPQSLGLSSSDIALLGDGSISIVVSAVDPAGNVSASSFAGFVLDTAAPAAPTINVVAGDDVLNRLETGTTLTGTTEADSAVHLDLGGRTVVATVTGTQWSYQLQPSDTGFFHQGLATLTATAIDRAGNLSAAASRQFTVDTVAPEAFSVVRGTTSNVDAAGNTNARGLLDFIVSFDDGTVLGAASASNWVALLDGAAVSGGVTAVTALGDGRFRVTVDASKVGAVDGTLSLGFASTSTIADAAGNAATITASGSALQTYVIDHVNQAPAFASSVRTVTVVENTPPSSVLLIGGATDPDVTSPYNLLTYSIAGADASLFNVDPATGALRFLAAPDFETGHASGRYQLMLIATDGGGRSALQTINVEVQDANEAPVVGVVIADQVAGIGQAFSMTLPAGAFVDPDASSSGANHQLTYRATQSDGSALPSWLHFDPATGAFTGTPSAAAHLDVTVTATDGGTPGLSASQTFALDARAAPSLTSTLAGVANLDASSSLVLTASEHVTAVAGKYVHIVDLGGAGYDGDSATHTQDILVTDASQVHVSGGRIVIDPLFDLDLSSRYAITVDEGAFIGASTHLGTSAIGASDLTFGTVTPGVGSSVADAASSQIVDTATGQLVAGRSWWSIEGVGSPGASKITADLSADRVTLVFKDWTAAGGDSARHVDGVGVKSPFWLEVSGFGADDLLYIDDQSNNALTANLLQYVNINHAGATPVRFAFDAAPGVGSEGQAWLDVTTTHGNALFGSVAELSTLLGVTSAVVSA